jgi:probable F420-dependent oxidoreductase
MLFTLAYPIGNAEADASFADPENVTKLVRAAEEAGFSTLAMTDHPAPSRKWLERGGHAGFDPLAALTFCAAVTTRIRLMTYLLVLPYRNPLLVAKSVATADRLSGGRLDLVVGSGYLRSEFAALGVDFDSRGELLDEAIDVLRKVFEPERFEYTGSTFVSRGVTIRPQPVQLPHPPIWIGGNGARARQRAALVGDGWSPFQSDAVGVQTARTVAMASMEDLRLAIADLHRRVTEAGRAISDVPIQLQTTSLTHTNDLPASGACEHIAELHALGVSRLVVKAPPGGIEETVEAISEFGREVIGHSAVIQTEERRGQIETHP